MKSKLLPYTYSLLIFSILLINKANAQSYYFDINTGYAINMFPKINTDVFLSSQTTTPSLKISGSFGKGLNYGATAGYFFLPYLAFETGVNQFIGSKLSSSQTVPIANNQAIILNESSSGKMLSI